MLKNITRVIHEGFIAGAIFIDLAKAFYTINHEILLGKLQSFGISGPPLRRFQSSLTSRSQVVQTNRISSSAKPITIGVLQGSILVPLLFLLFVKYACLKYLIVHNVSICRRGCFLHVHKTVAALQYRFNTDLNNVKLWLHHVFLRKNATTNFVLFYSSQSVINTLPAITIDSHILKVTKTSKFLGVILVEHFKFNFHDNFPLQKVSFCIQIIIKNLAHFQPHIIRTLYYAHIHSHLSNCFPRWVNTYTTHLDQLRRLEKPSNQTKDI